MTGIYLLNKITVYDSKLACIYNINEPQFIYNITTPANLCLLMLINQKDDVIPQRVFFREVWEKHNMAVSANTFYQNISIIRKAFRNAGLENIIITIPRRGLIFSSDVLLESNITIEHRDTQSIPPQIEKPNDSMIIEHDKQVPSEEKRDNEKNTLMAKSIFSLLDFSKLYRQNPKSIFIMLLGIVLLAFYFIIRQQGLSEDFFSNYKPIQNINGCRVYISDKDYEYSNKIVEETLLREAIHCEKEEVIYFSALKGLPRVSIVQCRQYLANNLPASCSSTYLIGY